MITMMIMMIMMIIMMMMMIMMTMMIMMMMMIMTMMIMTMMMIMMIMMIMMVTIMILTLSPNKSTFYWNIFSRITTIRRLHRSALTRSTMWISRSTSMYPCLWLTSSRLQRWVMTIMRWMVLRIKLLVICVVHDCLQPFQFYVLIQYFNAFKHRLITLTLWSIASFWNGKPTKWESIQR